MFLVANSERPFKGSKKTPDLADPERLAEMQRDFGHGKFSFSLLVIAQVNFEYIAGVSGDGGQRKAFSQDM